MEAMLLAAHITLRSLLASEDPCQWAFRAYLLVLAWADEHPFLIGSSVGNVLYKVSRRLLWVIVTGIIWHDLTKPSRGWSLLDMYCSRTQMPIFGCKINTLLYFVLDFMHIVLLMDQ